MQVFNYSLRYLLKKRGNTLARILSLSMGVAIALLVFSYVGLNLSFNNSFPNKERVFQVWAKSPQIGGMAHKLVKPLAPNLVADIPQVEAAVHFEEVRKIFGTTDNLMEATALQTNSSFFDVLDYLIAYHSKPRVELSHFIVIAIDILQVLRETIGNLF